MSSTLLDVAVITLVFLLAGLVKGVIGLGLPTVAMGLLGAVMPPAQAAALLVVPSFVTNVWQMASGPALAALAGRLWSMMLGIAAGTWAGMAAGIGVQAATKAGTATAALGAALVVYAVVSLGSPKLHVADRVETWLSPVTGAVTGLITAVTGVLVIPAAPYLQALGLQRDALVQAMGLSFTVSTVALAVGLVHDGVLERTLAGASLLALVPALAGMWLGQRLRARLQPALFRRWFLIGLMILGGYLVLRSLI